MLLIHYLQTQHYRERLRQQLIHVVNNDEVRLKDIGVFQPPQETQQVCLFTYMPCANADDGDLFIGCCTAPNGRATN